MQEIERLQTLKAISFVEPVKACSAMQFRHELVSIVEGEQEEGNNIFGQADC